MGTHETPSPRRSVERGSDRSFGLVFAAVFAVIGLFPLWRGADARWWALAVGALFLAGAIAYPALMAPLNRLWFKFGMLLGRVMEPVIMTLLFFIVFTPFALLARAVKGELLPLKFDKNARTYWIVRENGGTDLTRQF